MSRYTLAAATAAVLLACGSAAAQQCASFGFIPDEPGYDGDEPPEFSHYVDRDGDGACDRDEENALIVAWQDNGVHPNGFYPDCDVDGDGEIDESAGDQIGHGHWEYTHLHEDPRAYGDQESETEEKDYFTLPQAMEEDFRNQDPQGSASRESFGQTVRFALNEPVRFDRAFRPGANPSGRYWQVDEWIGPASSSEGQSVPGLTWTERFWGCFPTDPSPPAACATIDGQPAYGGYWSNHAQHFGYTDCGDGLTADPEFPRNAECGTAFFQCP